MNDPVEITGADIIGAVLRDYPALNAIVEVESIKGGRLPDGVALPALLVRTVSVIERQTLRRGASVHRVDRVSATVRARSYDEQVTVIGLVRRCCAGRTGSIAGAADVAILTAGTGPDMAGPADSFEQAQDFRVAFNTPA